MAQNNNNVSRTLVHKLEHHTLQFTPQDLFQATHRLKHYLIFTYLDIDDQQIDESARDYWKTSLIPTIRKSYRIPPNTSHPRVPRFDFILQPKSAYEWFQVNQTIATLHKTQHLTKEQLYLTISRDWLLTDDSTRQYYRRLACIDQERYTANKMEIILLHKGYDIGLSLPSTDNIVVSTSCPISDLLGAKISRLLVH